jgi:large subunit ribosomal protein L6
MSRVGVQAITIPAGVTVVIDGCKVTVKGPQGEEFWEFPPVVSFEQRDGAITVSRLSDEKFAKAMHGTARNLIANMIEGVKNGFTKELEIQGVGFRAAIQGDQLTMALGYSHPIEYKVPEGVTVVVTDNTKIKVTGINKQKVGQVGAHLRSFYPAEPYKGKGVRYKGEQVRRKAGKTVA